MFIHAFEGSWFSHPFWRSRFLLNDAKSLALIQESAVCAVVIDDAKGYGPRPATIEPPPVQVPDPPQRPSPPPVIRFVPKLVWNQPRPMAADSQRSEAAEDRARASKLVNHAKGVMKDLVATIPVSVILNPDAGLTGAAVHAVAALQEE